MHARSDVAPATLSVTLDEGGVAVEYLDGRETFYHGVPERVAGSVRTRPRTHVHVLVTGPEGREGVLTYVNDRTTHDDVLESSGVGRILLSGGDHQELFPGVEVRIDGMAAVVEANLDVVDGRVFVFEEDQFDERSFELVAEEPGEGDDSGERSDGSRTDHDPDAGSSADAGGEE